MRASVHLTVKSSVALELEPPGGLPQNWGGNEPNRVVTCMVLKAMANNRRHLALCHYEFRGPQSCLCRSGGIRNNNDRARTRATPTTCPLSKPLGYRDLQN
ncbi:uncharacterized protein TNCV_690601 [Trichonephila clavipes]|nr:uncharacterized protein TNCV_690601 [Trichonephila clavipes]